MWYMSFFKKFKKYCINNYAKEHLQSDLSRLENFQSYCARKSIRNLLSITPGVIEDFISTILNGRRPKTKKNDLIDKFIADAPSITPGKAVKENQSDLSKASSELKEDLVSENLAIIFAKQGKASKAIEIYKKLIWKFPQKKASFAARIEELKKK